MSNLSIKDILSRRENKTKSLIQTFSNDVNKEKLNTFINTTLPFHLKNNTKDIINFFKARPKDIYFLGYNKELTMFGTSIDGQKWTRLCKQEFKYAGFLPVPERGTIWKANNSRALYIILDFINCTGIIKENEFPSIIYMDELGNLRAMKIIDWHNNFVFCDFTMGKDK